MNRNRILVFSLCVGLACQGDNAESPATTADAPADDSGEGPDAKPVARSALGPTGPQVLVGGNAAGRPFEEATKGDDRGALMVAVDTPYQIFEGQGSYVHVGAWKPDGTPVKGASVYVGAAEMGTTDEHGALVFIFPPRGEKPTEKMGGVVTVVGPGKACGQVGFHPNVRTPSFSSDHLYVYTDRGAYRPGETVHVRGIGWHLAEDYEPLEGAEVEFSLRSEKGETIAAHKKTTDAFGISSLDIDIPPTATEGLYHLEVGYRQERGKARLQIKDFKPPRIRIEHTLGRFITADQTELEFDVTLKPGSGEEFGKGELSISAQAGGRERASAKTKIKGPGPHHLELSATQLSTLKGALSEGEYAKLVLKVRDDRGREDSLDREMRFAKNPYVAVIEADKDQYSTGDPVELVVKVSDLDGVPIRERELTVKVKGGSDLTAKTDAKGMAQFSLKMSSSNQDVEVFVDGVADPIARTTLRWIQPRPMRSHIPDPIIKEGGNAKVVVHFPTGIEPVEAVVHMDVVDTSGAVVRGVLLPVVEDGGEKIARGEFDSPSWGSMLLTFFTLGKQKGENEIGLLVEGQNLVVQPNRELEIVLDGLPDEARPGSELSVNATVKDAHGKPVKAAVGAAIVDARVLALKDPLEITPMDKFYNPELRTMSLTGSKILSWPVVTRNWGAHTRDIALPPFPYKPGGTIQECRVPDTALNGVSSLFSELGIKGSGKGGGGAGQGYGMADEAAPAMEAEPESPPPPPPPGKAAQARPSRRPAAKRVEITVRTRLPDTSLWAPGLRADGSVRIATTLPESTGPQELIVVASDANGGVGLVREPFQLDQPVFAEASFPPRLVAGATLDVPITVFNHTGKADTFSVRLASGLGGSGTTRVQVAAGSSETVALRLEASKAGPLEYIVTTTGGGHEDTLKGNVDVTPAGVPQRERTEPAVVTSSRPFERTFTVASGDTGNEAFLRMSFPSITAAFAGTEELAASVTDAPMDLGADLLTSVLVLRYADKHGISSPQLLSLRKRAMAALGDLISYQSRDGTFSYWRNGRSSPYVTAYVLEALLEAQALGLKTDVEVIAEAADALARPLAGGGLVKVSDVAFWEGDRNAVRLGLTAEVYTVLTMIPPAQRSATVTRAVDRLKTRFATYLRGTDLEPLAAGRALQAQLREKAISNDDARKVIDRLIEARDKGHWEPSWFHAWGGTIEATVAVLLAMEHLDPSGFGAQKRDALRYIQSTRESWGMWHNARGTAAAIRGLLAVGAPAESASATVTVELDGTNLATVAVDPADPFLSTIKLSHLTLGEQLSAGEHSVKVTYDGKLEPLVEVVSTRYLPASASAVSGHRLRARLGNTTLEVGAATNLVIDYEFAVPGEVATVLIPAWAALEVDASWLEASARPGGPIADYRLTEFGVSILLPPAKTKGAIKIPVAAVRTGSDPALVGLRVTNRRGSHDVTLAAQAGPAAVSGR